MLPIFAVNLIMIRLIADEDIPFLKGVLEPFADVLYLRGDLIDHKAVINADGLLVRTRTRCDESLLHSSSVKFIGTATIGYDHLDTEYCENNNIQWANAPGCNASSVRQYIASALLTMAGKHNFRLKDKTIGIVGVGNVGRKVEELATLLGMKVLLNDPPRERAEGLASFVPLDDLIQYSDIITLHTPLTRNGPDATFHLIGPAAFNKMKPGSWIINTARGEVIDNKALKKVLSEGKLGGAVLDVWENEPLADPELIKKVFIGTPHIAGYSADGKANGTAMIVRALSTHFHFPLQNWYPETIPPPVQPVIQLDKTSTHTGEIIGKAILQTYNILEDDARFRSDYKEFERQRKEYPQRREFPAFTVLSKGLSGEVVLFLQNLGYLLKVT